jgi:hypothetical protein
VRTCCLPTEVAASSGKTIELFSTGSSGCSTAAHSGERCPNAMASGRRYTRASRDGAERGSSIGFSSDFIFGWMRKVRSTSTPGTLMRPMCEQVGRRRERAGGEKKVPGEPADHALGRSRGGYGTKVHLVVCSEGIPLAATVTPGQAHESKHLEATLAMAKITRSSRGRPKVRPRNLGGDKG